ncbi:glycosyltransferase [Candidatus Roizmanbacteria bacterium]|nr:glycosyltransferase [Candidatus Roizmanbacteria bacterium]
MTAISIIIPTLNEEGTIVALIERIHKIFGHESNEYEIIIVDDGSTDRTTDEINTIVNKYPVYCFKKKGKKGKAQSLVEGFSYATYPVIAMIDADLQYPPEAIPQMLKKIDSGEADLVVANRRDFQSGVMRRILSRGFRLFFSQLLHGQTVDVQSGLKVFKREIYERISLHNLKPWSFDLEFLTKARHAGYSIASIDIAFTKRVYGKPKISLISAIFEIGFEAIKLWFKQPDIIHLHPSQGKQSGFHYKGVEFIHYSTLRNKDTAFLVLYKKQKLIFIVGIVLFLLALALNWFFTILSLVAFITVLYFFDLLFNLFLISRNFTHNPELSINQKEIHSLIPSKLPKYTILCPLYHEWEILPQFVKAMSALDYPKNKLQVMILLEEDDTETINKTRKFHLPSYFDIVIVPHSLPKTKPKALNYGLEKTTGQYLVIYDAEDIPDPKQLKKTVIAFQKAPFNTVCIQAKLNFYNPKQNILTRVFTAEYTLWFDLVLTGLQSISAPIPLGGTSNHFKTEKLRTLKGWDSFNVTEDCDLGMRLVKKGYSTALIHSITLEEANSDLKNWFQQRSRWIKGYIQTYLVHMRDPKAFSHTWRKPHLLTFQLIVGGKILSMFINPLMWITTILYFSLRTEIGPFISQFFPAPILYMGVFSLIFGNFLYMYYYMIGCAKKGQYDLIKYVFLVPIYWLAMSVAAWQAFIQLFTKPHFWPKTIHGLHIDRERALLQGAETSQNRKPRNHNWNKKMISSGSFLVFSLMVANGLNFIFNAFLGRILTFSDFGLLTLLNTFLYINTIFTGALGSTTSHRVAYLSSKKNPEIGKQFFSAVFTKFLFISFVYCVLWIISIPFIVRFFQVHSFVPVLLFTPVLALGFLEAIASGYLQGSFSFATLGIIAIVSTFSKFAVALIVILLGFQSYAYVPIVLMSIVSFLFVFGAVYKTITFKTVGRTSLYHFPKKFFFINCIAGLSASSFITIDVLLANHYLSPAASGQYAFLSLAGKMIFFLGSTFNLFIFSFVGRNEGLNKNSNRTFYRLLFGSGALTFCIYLFVGPFGYLTMPFFFGIKTIAIIPYLNTYALAIAMFTISNSILNYDLARKRYYSSYFSLGMTVLLASGIVVFHSYIRNFVDLIFIMSVVRLIGMLYSHFYYGTLESALRNLNDFTGAFKFKSNIAPKTKGQNNILIFNWRDTKHRFAGGAEVYIHELAKRWVKAGHNVTLFCGNDGHNPRNEMIDGIEIVRRGGFYFVYIWAFLYYILKFRGKYHTIIDCENGIPFFTPLYSRENKYLLIHHVHQEVFMKSLRPPLSWLAIFLESRAMPWAYKNTNVITVSPSSKQEIMDYKLTTKEPKIIFNGVDVSKYKPGKKSKHPTILYVGRLKLYKSLHVFIHAALKVLKEFPTATFIIAGDGEELKKLRKLVSQLGLTEKVRLLGKVTEEEKIRLYQKAWIFMNPSFMEGWGITSIEANACGTPVIASNVPGLRDSVRNPTTGILVEYGNSDKFALEVSKMLKDREFRTRLSRNSVDWAQNFTWEKSAESSLTLFL